MANIEFDTLEQLNKYITKCLKKCMSELGQKYKDVLVDYIDEKWYSDHTPNPASYKRTKDFINSATFKLTGNQNDGYDVEIYFDTSKIHPEIRKKGFNAHASIRGKDVSSLIPIFIDKGVNSEVHSYDGIEWSNFIEGYIKENYLKDIKKLMKKYGIEME